MCVGTLIFFFGGGVFVYALDRNPQRFQKMQVLRGKRAVFLRSLCARSSRSMRCRLLFGNLIQSDCCLKHKQDIKALPANILHHAGNIFRLRDTRVNGLSKFLDQLAHFLIQDVLRFRPATRATRADTPLTLLVMPAPRNPKQVLLRC